MGRWLWMTGGLVVWTAHFCGLYALSSLADVVARADDADWRMAGLAFSGVCALVCLTLLLAALRRKRTDRSDFPTDIAALAAAMGFIAVVWQTVPIFIGF